MGKLVALLLSLAALCGVSYLYLKGGLNSGGADVQQGAGAKQTLDRVRTKANEIEKDAQRRAQQHDAPSP